MSVKHREVIARCNHSSTGMRALRLANIGMTEFGAETFSAAMDQGTFTKHLQELDLRYPMAVVPVEQAT
jgi:hypothetical protein